MTNEKVIEKKQIVQPLILGILAFVTPTFLAMAINAIFGKESIIANNAQVIVGSIVNILLILAAVNLKSWKQIIPIIFMPSISAIFSGLVLKTSAVYAMYMIPGIWVGNFVFVLAFRKLFKEKNWNYVATGVIAIIAKVAVIFGTFSMINSWGIIPAKIATVMTTQMGITQLITATIATVTMSIYFIAKEKE